MSRPALVPIQAPTQWIPGDGPSPGLKRPGREADHLPAPSAEVKNGGAVPPVLHISSWHSAKLINHRDNFAFLLPNICLNSTLK
jgi:hypothetical protein